MIWHSETNLFIKYKFRDQSNKFSPKYLPKKKEIALKWIDRVTYDVGKLSTQWRIARDIGEWSGLRWVKYGLCLIIAIHSAWFTLSPTQLTCCVNYERQLVCWAPKPNLHKVVSWPNGYSWLGRNLGLAHSFFGWAFRELWGNGLSPCLVLG